MARKENPYRDNLRSNKDNPTVCLVNLSFNQEHLMFLGGKCIHHRDNLLCNNNNLTFHKTKILYSKDNPTVLHQVNLVFRGNLVHLNHRANLFHKGNLVALSI